MKNDLPFVVECRWIHVFEPIAAFNCMEAAEVYARKCVEANADRALPLSYRIRFGKETKVVKL